MGHASSWKEGLYQEHHVGAGCERWPRTGLPVERIPQRHGHASQIGNGGELIGTEAGKISLETAGGLLGPLFFWIVMEP